MSQHEHANQHSMPQPGRPHLPAGYGVDPATSEGMLPWSHVSDRMTSSRNYWVGTTRPDGQPHVAPVWGVWLDQTFYFSTDQESQKGRNLVANPSLVVHLESGDDVVILEGSVEKVTDASLLSRFADAYVVKYQIRPDVHSPASPVYRLLPKLAYAWLEADFPRTATRWRFDLD